MKQLTIKGTVDWSAQEREEAAPESLCKAWNKLLPPTPSSSGGAVAPSDGSTGSTDVFQELGYEEGRDMWQKDSSDPGYHLMLDCEVAQVSGELINQLLIRKV